MALKNGKRKRKNKTKHMTPSVTVPEQSSFLTSTTEKRILLDDKTQTKPITINQTLVPVITTDSIICSTLY
jgi:hypothetical protein